MRFALVIAVLAACSGPRFSPSDPLEEGEFSIVLLPDTQHYVNFYPEVFHSQTEWIAANKDALRIKMVIHLGDLTYWNQVSEWLVADAAMARLDDVVPYTVLPGNHDGLTEATGNTNLYNHYFGPQRFEGREHYLGHLGSTNDNNVAAFTAQGRDWLVVNLGWGTRQDALEWAAGVIEEHPDHLVIVATHGYMNDDGSRLGRGDQSAVEHEGETDGDQIWNQLIRRHANIFMVVSGHITGGGYLTSYGDAGNRVHQLLVNYQGDGQGGSGFLRVLRFRPATDDVAVYAYSTSLEKYARNRLNEFTLAVPFGR